MVDFSLVSMVDTLDESRKQVRGISFGCACEGCKEKTIKRGHLIQQRPFLYSISDFIVPLYRYSLFIPFNSPFLYSASNIIGPLFNLTFFSK